MPSHITSFAVKMREKLWRMKLFLKLSNLSRNDASKSQPDASILFWKCGSAKGGKIRKKLLLHLGQFYSSKFFVFNRQYVFKVVKGPLFRLVCTVQRFERNSKNIFVNYVLWRFQWAKSVICARKAFRYSNLLIYFALKSFEHILKALLFSRLKWGADLSHSRLV